MNHEGEATWIYRGATESVAGSLSISSLGSHASYDNLKTIAVQVEQWVHRSHMKQKADLKTGKSSAEADVTSAAQSRAAYAVQSCSSAESFRGTAQCSSSMIDFNTRG